LFDQQGSLFAYYTSAHARVVVSSEPARRRPALESTIQAYRPVLADNKVVGVLAIATDLTPFRYDSLPRDQSVDRRLLLVAYVVTASMQRISAGGALSGLMSRVLLEAL
jgi:hypothetical protein